MNLLNSNKGSNRLTFEWLPQPSNYLISACAIHCSHFIIVFSVLPFSMSLSTLRSDVWEHFKRMENSAVCVHCKKELSYCKTTMNLRNHLIRIHPNKYFTAEKKETTKSQKTSSEDLIVEMILLDLGPAAMVECTGFKCRINYRVPSAVHITSCLETKYVQAKSTVIEMLKEPSHIALTTDI